MLTVIAVSTLPTLAMVAYPTIARWMALDPHKAGIFLGGTIHDVAQVVGAGYSMSQETGDTATLVKLLRVAMLLPNRHLDCGDDPCHRRYRIASSPTGPMVRRRFRGACVHQ